MNPVKVVKKWDLQTKKRIWRKREIGMYVIQGVQIWTSFASASVLAPR